MLTIPLALAMGAAAPAGDDAGATPVAAPSSSADSATPAPEPTDASASAPPPAPPASSAAPAAAGLPARDGGQPLVDSPALHSAFVHLYVDYPDAVLELRSYIDDTDWKEACRAPCDRLLRVDGMDARVVAAGMSTSNAFRIDAGRGTANLKVEGGSARSRTIGTIGFAGGIPLALAGMGLWGYGKIEDHPALRTAGIVTLGVAAVMVVGSLPFLGAGSTKVRDGKGKAIANGFTPPSF